MNTITASIAAQQVTLALKILLGNFPALGEKEIVLELYHFNIWNFEFKKIKVKKNKNCKTCQGIYTYLEKKEETRLIKFCGLGRFQVQGKAQNLNQLKQRWEKVGEVVADTETISFKNILLFKDGRALIKADSEEEALAMYSKWVGN